MEVAVDETSERGGADHLRLRWQERGGPRAEPPQREGYGLQVIRELVGYELDAKAELVFGAEGVRCEVRMPLEEVEAGVRTLQSTGPGR